MYYEKVGPSHVVNVFHFCIISLVMFRSHRELRCSRWSRPIQTRRYVVQEELFWRERQEKLRVLSGLKASTSSHNMVASSIAHPAYIPPLLQTWHSDKETRLQEVRNSVPAPFQSYMIQKYVLLIYQNAWHPQKPHHCHCISQDGITVWLLYNQTC